MLRLNPVGYYRLVQASQFESSYAGGEANVAVSLANYGMSAAFVTKVPEHEIGQCAVNAMRQFGVDTTHMYRGGSRLGVYYAEKGASQRPSKVIYDRAGSSIATAKPEEFQWDEIFRDADWFHFTGITPALGGDLPKICLDACKAAKKRGLTVSCDLNYRKKLWSREDAGRVMAELMPYVDVCISNEEDAKDVFNIEAANNNVEGGNLNRQGYISVAQQLQARFGTKMVAITLRESLSANDNNWGAMLYCDGQAYFSPTYRIHIVDRVGGGDSFGAGLIYGVLEEKAPQDAINFATAASCLKHQDEIKTILPHREPMLLVTSVEDLRPGEDIRAVFFADSEMDIFRGHFPEEPILPGVYSIECMAQAVDILLMTTPRYARKTPLLLGVDSVRFRKKILPGDTLEIHAYITSEQKEKAIVTCAAEIYVHQERVANGDITIAMR